MKAGKLDRRITVLRQGAPVDDGYTVKPDEFEDFCRRSASWMAANGREVFETMGKEAKAGGTFWIRSDSVTRTITEKDAVRFENRIWQITGIQTMGRNDRIELIVVSGD